MGDGEDDEKSLDVILFHISKGLLLWWLVVGVVVGVVSGGG